jgi:hypothetical protein
MAMDCSSRWEAGITADSVSSMGLGFEPSEVLVSFHINHCRGRFIGMNGVGSGCSELALKRKAFTSRIFYILYDDRRCSFFCVYIQEQ